MESSMEFRKVSSGKITNTQNRYSSGKIIDNAKKKSTTKIRIKYLQHIN